MARYPEEHGTVTCKGCGGWLPRQEGRSPAGWYGLTVSVPPQITTGSDRGYVWVGQFCSVACLAASVPDLERQEELAHLATNLCARWEHGREREKTRSACPGPSLAQATPPAP